MSHIYDVNHVTCLIHIWTSHVSREWVMSHMNESCLTWMSLTRMSHVSHGWVTSHINRVTHIYDVNHVICLIHIWHESFIMSRQVTWVASHIWMSHVRYEWVTSYMDASRHICMSRFMNEKRLFGMSHVTHEWFRYEWVTFLAESSLIWMSYISHMIELHISYEWVTFLIWMSHISHRVITHMNESQFS